MQRSQLNLLAVTVVWLFIALFGMSRLQAYESQVGAGSSKCDWPQGTSLQFSQAGTLVVFIHPKCPCSRATVHQLERVLSNAPSGLTVDAVVINPELKWSDSDIVRSLKGLPNANIKMDATGEEAQRFGAATSGQVVFFDGAGTERFAGGITESRGHEGDCDGLAALQAAIAAHNPNDFVQTPVFGCALMHGDKETSLCRK